MQNEWTNIIRQKQRTNIAEGRGGGKNEVGEEFKKYKLPVTK